MRAPRTDSGCLAAHRNWCTCCRATGLWRLARPRACSRSAYEGSRGSRPARSQERARWRVRWRWPCRWQCARLRWVRARWRCSRRYRFDRECRRPRPRSLCDTSSTRACPVLDIYIRRREVGSVNTGQPLGKGFGVDAARYIPDLLGSVPFGAQRLGFFFVRKGNIELGAHGGSLVLQVQVAQGYRRAQTSRRFAEKLRFGWVRDALVSASVAIGAVLIDCGVSRDRHLGC